MLERILFTLKKHNKDFILNISTNDITLSFKDYSNEVQYFRIVHNQKRNRYYVIKGNKLIQLSKSDLMELINTYVIK